MKIAGLFCKTKYSNTKSGLFMLRLYLYTLFFILGNI